MTIIAETTASDPFLNKKKPLADKNPDGFNTPEGTRFRITDKGVAVISTDKDGLVNLDFLCGPLTVKGEFISESGDKFFRLVEFIDVYGHSHQQLLSKGDIDSDINTVRAELISQGLQWYMIEGRSRNSFLIGYLLHAPVDKKPGILISDYGWYELGKIFVLSDGKGDATIVGKPDRPMLFKRTAETPGPKYGQSGTLPEWQTTIGKIAGYSTRGMFFIAAAFSGALLDFVPSIGSGGFHMAGASSTGKSTVMHMSSTVWGAYGTQGDVASWHATGENGDEAALAERTDSVVFLDEMHEAEPRTLTSRIYQLGNSTGKRRQSVNLKAQRRLTWSVMVLSSGEHATKDYLAQHNLKLPLGAEVRLSTIQACSEGETTVWDRLPKEELQTSEDLTLYAADVGSRIYGSAGPAFLHQLINDVENRGGVTAMSEYLSNEIRAWTDAYVPFTSGQVRRVARRFGIVAVAGELAIKYGVLPWKEGDVSAAAASCFNSFLEHFEDPDLRQERFCMLPEEFVVTWPHHFRFFNPGATKEIFDPKEQSPVYGFVFQAEHGADEILPAMIFFTKEGFLEMCGQEVEREVLTALNSAGRLVKNELPRLTYKTSRSNRDTQPLLGVVPVGPRYTVVCCVKGYKETIKEALLATRFGKNCIKVFEALVARSNE